MKSSSATCKSSSGEYRVFVSGIPRRSSTEDVLEYFSKFGPVRVEKYQSYFKKQKAKPTYKGGNGYCILLVESERTFSGIMATKTHVFFGRTLDVAPMRQGMDLIAFNADRNNRRVLLKGVPHEVCQETLIEVIQSSFGQVDKIFKYLADDPKTSLAKSLKQKKNTYSVTLADKDAADLLAENEVLQLPVQNSSGINITIRVEKFRRTKLQPENSESRKLVSNSRTSPQDNTPARWSDPTSKGRSTLESRESGLGFQQRNTAGDCHRKPTRNTLDVEPSQEPNHLFFQEKWSLQIYASKESLVSNETPHDVKPTSARYFLNAVFVQYAESQSANESGLKFKARTLKQPSHELSNIRFSVSFSGRNCIWTRRNWSSPRYG